jgi:hypothetical protein
MRLYGAWVHGKTRVALLAAAAATLATHPMRADATEDYCRDRALRGDRALNIYRTVR